MAAYEKLRDSKVIAGWVWRLLGFLGCVLVVLVLACLADAAFGHEIQQEECKQWAQLAHDVAHDRNSGMGVGDLMRKYMGQAFDCKTDCIVKDHDDYSRLGSFVSQAYAVPHVDEDGSYNATYQGCVQYTLQPKKMQPQDGTGARGPQIES